MSATQMAHAIEFVLRERRLPRRRVPRRLPVVRRLDREHRPVRRGEVRVERSRVRREPGRDRRRGNLQLGVRRLSPSRAESRTERPTRDGVAVQRLRRLDAAGPRGRSLSARRAVPDRRSQLRACLPDGRPRGGGARPARTRSWAIARLRARRRRSRLRSASGDGVRDSRAAGRARGRGADVMGSASGRVCGARASRRRIGSGRGLRGRPHRHECGRRASRPASRRFPTMSTSSGRAGSRPLRSSCRSRRARPAACTSASRASCARACLRPRPAGRHASAPRNAAWTSSLRPCTPLRPPRSCSTPSLAPMARAARSSTSCFARASRTACSAASGSTPTATSPRAR